MNLYFVLNLYRFSNKFCVCPVDCTREPPDGTGLSKVYLMPKPPQLTHFDATTSKQNLLHLISPMNFTVQISNKDQLLEAYGKSEQIFS